MHSYSTADVAPGARLTYWNDLHRDVFSPVEFTPVARAEFRASILVDELGPLQISRHSSAPTTIDHTARHVALSTERRIALLLPLAGAVRLSHYGRESLLREGDFALVDPYAPIRLELDGWNSSLGLGIPYDVLAAGIPEAEGMFGLEIRGDGGIGALIGTLLAATWTEVERGLAAELRPTVAKAIVDLIGAAYAAEHGATVSSSSLVSARRVQIKRFVEANLKDAALSPGGIAAAIGLSARYVRGIFAADGESLSAYILRRRLEECARQLTSATWRGRSITDTAFEWGFSSMAHFTRVFKNRFGVTPREYRRLRSRGRGPST